ncbi:vesicular inhibitory amino acid transporter-like isoform 3-T3 [Spinachia spinachia]
MGSLRWAHSSGRPWSVAGSLWGWAASRLHLDWTSRRLFPEDEEMLILTRSDELNRTYGENLANKNDPDDPPKTSRTSAGGTEQDNPSVPESPSTFLPETTAFKETRASVISTGPRAVTVTSAVSSGDAFWFRNTDGQCGKGRRSSEEEENGQGEDTVEGTSQVCTSCHEERRMSLRVGGGNPTLSITTWEAGWNVTNAIQGIFVLGLPFALLQSGYVGLVLLVLSAWFCNHTGRILVACLYEEEQSGSVSMVRVRHSYQDIVEAGCKGLWPNLPILGGWLVNVAQVIELLMTCTLYLVVSTSLLSDSLWGMAVPRSVCSLVSLVFLLPCLLLTDLRPVSTLSLLCSLAHILISLMVMLHCLSRASSWSWSTLPLSVDPEDFVVSVGVIIFSYTSQIFLPPLEGSMKDRGQFNCMLGWTHGAACIMKTLFSLLAVLTWGAETNEVITDNLPSDLRPLINLSLLAKALLSYPLPFYSAAEILQSCLLGEHGGRGVSRLALLVRIALLMTSYVLALIVPRFSLLMGLTGSVTGAAMTLILPCLFHLRLQWGRLTVEERVIDLCILSLGVICSVSGVICSVQRLVGGM